jgi:hypothetical protein
MRTIRKFEAVRTCNRQLISKTLYYMRLVLSSQSLTKLFLLSFRVTFGRTIALRSASIMYTALPSSPTLAARVSWRLMDRCPSSILMPNTLTSVQGHSDYVRRCTKPIPKRLVCIRRCNDVTDRVDRSSRLSAMRIRSRTRDERI